MRPRSSKTVRVSTERHSNCCRNPSPGLKLIRLQSWPWPVRLRRNPFSDTTTVTGSSATFFFRRRHGVRRLDERAAGVAELLRGGADFGDDLTPKNPSFARRRSSDARSLLSFFEFAFDREGFEFRQLAQAHLKDVVRLTLGEREFAHQVGLRLFAVPDHLDHAVEVEEHDPAAFIDVDAVEDLLQARPAPAAHRLGTERDPLAQDVEKPLLLGLVAPIMTRFTGTFDSGGRSARGASSRIPDGRRARTWAQRPGAPRRPS